MLYNFYIKTFGCQMNFFDSLKIENLLKENNYIKVSNYLKSHYIIINTCSVRKTSQNKIFNFIKNIYKKKKYFLLILSGCSSNIFYKYFIIKKYTHIILGTHDISKINILIKFYNYYKVKQISINFYLNENYKFFIKKNNKYILISQGCNKNCSFCLIPKTRNFEISKNIIKLFVELYKNFENNITLLGQNVSSYKFFINKKFIRYNDLIDYINLFKNIFTYNFISNHIKDFKKNFYLIYKSNKKLKNIIHLPIQSFSFKLLKYMRRNYNLKYIKLFFHSLKNINFSKLICTDIIICFYKELNLDFNKNVIFIEKFLLDKSFVFLYNKRPFTYFFYLKFKYSCVLKFYRTNKIFKKFNNNIIYINKILLKKFINLKFLYFCLDSNFVYLSFYNQRLVKVKSFFYINYYLKFLINFKLYNFFF